MVSGTVYKIVDRDDQCIYVGSTTQDVHAQMRQHKQQTLDTVISHTICEAPNDYMVHTILATEFETVKEVWMAEQQVINELRPIHNQQLAYLANSWLDAVLRYQAHNPNKVKQWKAAYRACKATQMAVALNDV